MFTSELKLIRCNDVNWISVSWDWKVTFFEQGNKFQMSKDCVFLNHLDYSYHFYYPTNALNYTKLRG